MSSLRIAPETETALADAPTQTANGLDATIARLEQNSREVQEFLDSIEQKISRMEPRLERLRQSPAPGTAATNTPEPTPDTESPVPQDAAPPDPPSPPLRYAAATPAEDGQALQPQPPAPPVGQRRRRSDQDDSDPKQSGSRRRLPFPAHAASDDLFTGRSTAAFAALLRSPLAWIATASLLLIGVLILAHISDTQPTTASAPARPASFQPDAVDTNQTSPAGVASARSSLPSTVLPKPSATTPAPTPALQPSTTQPTTPGLQAVDTPPSASPVETAATTDSASVANTPYATPRSVGTKFHVSSGVMAGNLLYSRAPDPPGGLARLFHLQGKVTMEVVISRSGRVQNIKVLSGHRLLRGPARDAVSTWRYRPYLVSGSPVEVATIVSVEFRR